MYHKLRNWKISIPALIAKIYQMNNQNPQKFNFLKGTINLRTLKILIKIKLMMWTNQNQVNLITELTLLRVADSIHSF